jgi:DNA-binding NarL/FixJ family response regulator
MGERQGARASAVDDAAFEVLVVVGDPMTARSLARITAASGQTVVCDSAKAARKALVGSASWGAFVIDPKLPDGSGLDVLRVARERCPLVAATFCSAGSDAHVDDAAFDLGAYCITRGPGWEARVQRFLGLARTRLLTEADNVRITLQEWEVRFRLSAGHCHILGQAAEGRTRAEIAAMRGTTEWTVRDQEERIAEKTKHKNFAAAVKALLLEAARRTNRRRR